MLSGQPGESLVGIVAWDRARFEASFVSGQTADEYLWDYLADLRATAVVVEDPYVDRHFLDDYAAYYARSFRPPKSPHCERLHFFAGFAADELDERFRSIAAFDDASRDEAEVALSRSYLGFVVVRPLCGARFGRTVLRTYPSEGGRTYAVVRRYTAHVAGVTLRIDGLAFQQQDRGAAVCASTALWSALQRTARAEGQRSPTPSTITAAARSPFPASHGLNLQQMAAALSNLGYAADYVAPAGNLPLFRAKIAAYLRSHVPVILLLEGTEGHAVTVTGFREPPTPVAVPAPHPDVSALSMRDGGLSVLYVHDDNLGSHAHYELRDRLASSPRETDALELYRGDSSKAARPWWKPDVWTVTGALVPKPAKLRMPIDDLFALAWGFRSVVDAIFPFPWHLQTYITSGISYQRELRTLTRQPGDAVEWMRHVHLPRHLGVLRVLADGLHLFDLLLDVTEVDTAQDGSAVLACVAPTVEFASRAWEHLNGLCTHLRVPLLVS